jgi:small nuclear ribonucleoprotein
LSLNFYKEEWWVNSSNDWLGDALLEPSKKPLNVLTKRLNTHVVITLKNGVEYHGTMVRCDSYMNLLLDGASEHLNDNVVANYGNVLVRGNNILYIAIDVPHK